MGMLKEITINRPVLAKLFANVKSLHEGCVLRATVWYSGKGKDLKLNRIRCKAGPHKLAALRGLRQTIHPINLYLKNGTHKKKLSLALHYCFENQMS